MSMYLHKCICVVLASVFKEGTKGRREEGRGGTEKRGGEVDPRWGQDRLLPT